MGTLKLWFSTDGLTARRRNYPNRLINRINSARLYRAELNGAVAAEPVVSSYDWSDSNLPWAYTSTSQFTAKWPSGVTIVDIQTGSTDFYTNLQNTVNAAGQRVVVRLGAGVYRLNQFRMIGSSGDPTYAFGFWFPNLRGFLGQGPDKTFIQMDANSYSNPQLEDLKSMAAADFAPLQAGFCRLDGSAASPILIAGVTFRGADQQMLTSTQADVNIAVPQPAPYQGVTLYANASSIVSYVRFQAAARAANSQPPFEMANLSSQYGSHQIDHCEFDSRLSADFNAARPRRCGVLMAGNETLYDLQDSWMHHSNVSRYAANDQNRNTSGVYNVTRCKIEQISNVQNKDPALNNGASLGGYTNATPFGWESTNGTINIKDTIIFQDNTFTDRQIAQHFQLTHVGARDPDGGVMKVIGGVYHNAWSQLEGWVCFRITTSYWTRSNYASIEVRDTPTSPAKTPYVYAGTWPPTSAQLAAAGVAKETHYLIRNG